MLVVSCKMSRWLILLGFATSTVADPNVACASIAEALLPRGPLIVTPRPNELITATGSDGERGHNLHDVTLQLDYASPLQGHVVSEAHAACLRLLVVVGALCQHYITTPAELPS
jgi:hypothetical protein